MTDVFVCADPEAAWIQDQRRELMIETRPGVFVERDESLRALREKLAHRVIPALQLLACDRCTQGVMDATNSHYLGLCDCPCHERAEA